MSDAVSSSVDDFLDDIEDGAINDSDLESASGDSQTKNFTDSRRRLEERLAERRLARDIQEYDFDVD